MDVALGGSAGCALTAAGEITCWGSSAYPPPTDGPYTRIFGGSLDFCALDRAGQATCWGEYAQTWSLPAPPTDDGWSELSLGSLFGCGLAPDGSVHCGCDDGSTAQVCADAPTW